MPDPETPAAAYKRWILDTGARLRAEDPPPQSLEDVKRRGDRIRRRMRVAERDALLPNRERVPFQPQILGVLERDGYRLERLIFQTRPGCWVTAHTYVPTGVSGKLPAVLAVHGHWQGARRDPVVQSRNIGLAKLGFFVLSLDAWGAGERGTRVGENEYHGGLLGASLWPVGTPLHGLQLHDNVRALDYLQSRPEVDPERLGCTGASGGGNQTTYLSAFDERVKCAVPVCSVGRTQDYLNTACCVDEVLLGALTFAEEGDLLGSVAPRALMVVTATRDSFHFGPQSAGPTVERARTYFEAAGAEDRIRHVLIESGHDYSRPMREAMYGWMRKWLKGEGDGSPTPEPPITPEDPETLRCFPSGFRPGRIMTTVQWVRQRGAELANHPPVSSRGGWHHFHRRGQERLRSVLRLPDKLQDEPPLELLGPLPTGKGGRTVILLDPQGKAAAEASPLAQRLREAGLNLMVPELRGCGSLALPGQGLGPAIPDHNLVEWSLWIDRPLLGQWVTDIHRLVERLDAPAAVVGVGEAGIAALCASALYPELRGAAAVGTLASYAAEGPPHNQRMVVFSPDLLKVGDVQHLAALSAPRPVLIAGPVELSGAPLPREALEKTYGWARRVYGLLDEPDRFRATDQVDEREIAAEVSGWLSR